MSSAIDRSPENVAQAKRNLWVVWELFTNVVLSIFFLRFVILNGVDFWQTWRISSLLIMAKVTTSFIFYLTRRLPKDISLSLYDWIIGVAGAFSVFFFQPLAGSDTYLGQALQMAGFALQVYAMLSLNRSIGFIAADRGIMTGGMYRWVRHPLYTAYIVAFCGYVLNHPSLYNIGVYACMILLLVLRLAAEERLLVKNAEYQEYARKVRWRLLPFVY